MSTVAAAAITCGAAGAVKGIDSDEFAGTYISGGQIEGRVCEVASVGSDKKTATKMETDGGTGLKITFGAAHGFLAKEVLVIDGVVGMEALNGQHCTAKDDTDATTTTLTCTNLDYTKFPGAWTATNPSSGGTVQRDYFSCKTGGVNWNHFKGLPGDTPGTLDQPYADYTSGGVATVIGSAGVSGVSKSFDFATLGNDGASTSGRGQGDPLAATECEEEVACTAGTPWTEVAITDIGVTGSQVVIKAVNAFTNGMKVKLSGIFP
jgi:hypothetical protein